MTDKFRKVFIIMCPAESCVCIKNSDLWSLLHQSLSSSNRLESPTRTLTLEAPKGVEVNAGVGEFKASCRKDLTLESSEGEVSM